MPKKILILVVAITIIIVTIATVFEKNRKTNNSIKNEIINGTTIDVIDDIQTVTELQLNTSGYINSMEKVKIEGSNDYIIITDDVKWEFPELEEGETATFSFAVPYTIVADEEEYNGQFILGDFEQHKEDGNPKYNIEISDLTASGKIKVLVEEK